jgi:hypothetical protein
VYYFNDDPKKERFIGATVWNPLTLQVKAGTE